MSMHEPLLTHRKTSQKQYSCLIVLGKVATTSNIRVLVTASPDAHLLRSAPHLQAPSRPSPGVPRIPSCVRVSCPKRKNIHKKTKTLSNPQSAVKSFRLSPSASLQDSSASCYPREAAQTENTCLHGIFSQKRCLFVVRNGSPPKVFLRSNSF